MFLYKNQYESLRSIARKLNRNHSTLSRELKRNQLSSGSYMPCSANSHAWERLHRQRREAPLKKPFINSYVREKLHLRWSPETIAGRLKYDHPGFSIHFETIYQYIYAAEHKDKALWTYLTQGRIKRKKKHGRKVRELRLGRIYGATGIDKRPEEISNRDVVGHWETDCLIGKQSERAAVSTTVERATRYTILTKLPNTTAEVKNAALFERLHRYPKELRRTLTTDNGHENARHRWLTWQLSMPVFFCHAYASWEKGSVENTNGRIRRYIPKGTSINILTEKDIGEVEYQLNNTPRKCLRYRTPNEVMQEALMVKPAL